MSYAIDDAETSSACEVLYTRIGEIASAPRQRHLAVFLTCCAYLI